MHHFLSNSPHLTKMSLFWKKTRICFLNQPVEVKFYALHICCLYSSIFGDKSQDKRHEVNDERCIVFEIMFHDYLRYTQAYNLQWLISFVYLLLNARETRCRHLLQTYYQNSRQVKVATAGDLTLRHRVWSFTLGNKHILNTAIGLLKLKVLYLWECMFIWHVTYVTFVA